MIALKSDGSALTERSGVLRDDSDAFFGGDGHSLSLGVAEQCIDLNDGEVGPLRPVMSMRLDQTGHRAVHVATGALDFAELVGLRIRMPGYRPQQRSHPRERALQIMGDHRHHVTALVQQATDRRHVLEGLPLVAEGEDGGGRAKRERSGAAHGHDSPENAVEGAGENRPEIEAVKRDKKRQQRAARPQRRQAGDENRRRIGRGGAETRREVE